MKSQEEWTAVLEHEPIAANEYYEFEETRELVLLVQEAAALIRQKGVAAFNEFRESGSHWRQDERYIFVLDPDGTMLVHPDAEMEFKNQMQLKDIQGKFIIRGLLDAAMAIENKSHGWYHYQWPVPGGLLPRWKSSYVERVATADGKNYVVGSGMYNDRMERAFVVDTVLQAAAILKKEDRAAFKRFRDPKDAFRFKDAYLFVIDMNGVEWVNPAFPNIEGRKMLDLHDSQGKYLYRDMIQMIQDQGEGWLDYMWPKPGERISTQKSAFVKGVQVGDQTLMVGCGVYLEDAPVETRSVKAMSAAELMHHVREAA
ncbi:MAG TPA: cache domain-containing protein, partial [Saprospiraceae bacterium]|nr:cache domain-containing protein [Saprospiraceae bacterium]